MNPDRLSRDAVRQMRAQLDSEPTPLLDPVAAGRRRRRWRVGLAGAASVLILAVSLGLLAPNPDPTTPPATEPPSTVLSPPSLVTEPPPAFGVVPESARLDFLFTQCRDTVDENQVETESCFLVAHFLNEAGLGTSGWPTGEPFHIRHGFVNFDDAPLGPGFGIRLVLERTDDPGVTTGGDAIDPYVANVYVPDYSVKVDDRCGPAYLSQDLPQPCEQFVIDFPEGLPRGRYSLRLEWIAPCSAWPEIGITPSSSCPDSDPSVVLFTAPGAPAVVGPGIETWDLPIDVEDPMDALLFDPDENPRSWLPTPIP